jgi:hypothetical protein
MHTCGGEKRREKKGDIGVSYIRRRRRRDASV